jgi:hypothetical protein
MWRGLFALSLANGLRVAFCCNDQRPQAEARATILEVPRENW